MRRSNIVRYVLYRCDVTHTDTLHRSNHTLHHLHHITDETPATFQCPSVEVECKVTHHTTRKHLRATYIGRKEAVYTVLNAGQGAALPTSGCIRTLDHCVQVVNTTLCACMLLVQHTYILYVCS